MVSQIPKHLLCRVLYPNPVCLLCTSSPSGDLNVMTISWLTPLNSSNKCILCVKSTRHSAANLRSTPSARFTLNIATAAMRSLLRQVGSCSGKSLDKITDLGIGVCAPGWVKTEDGGECFGIEDAAAHVLCVCDEIIEREGHLVIFATIEKAWARDAYWDGRNLIRRANGLGDDILTFLGSGVFGKVVPFDGNDEEDITPSGWKEKRGQKSDKEKGYDSDLGTILRDQ